MHKTLRSLPSPDVPRGFATAGHTLLVTRAAAALHPSTEAHVATRT